MKKCLFLVSFCLVPFVVFSSSFIELPSGNSIPVLDTNGNALENALEPGARYRIVSTGRGAMGGDVYLGPSPNSSVTPGCFNGVFRYNSDVGPTGSPVGFLAASSDSDESGIFENQDIKIVFLIPVPTLCVKYTIWKVGDYDASLGARLLETGGTIGQENSSWFKIVKSLRVGYNLFYCPGPFACPSCPIDQCQAVGVVIQNGKRRLALVNDQPLGVNFVKV